MKKAISLILVSALVMLPCVPALAWSGPGHAIIAAEAYRQLTPEMQKKVGAILRAHPDFEKWEKAFNADTAGMGLPLYVFMRASAWPDKSRRTSNRCDQPNCCWLKYTSRP